MTYAIATPQDYDALFDDDSATYLSQGDLLRVSVADEALATLIPRLISLADEATNKASLAAHSQSDVDDVLRHFARVIPMERCRSLAALLNAAWVAFADPNLWADIPQVRKDRDRILKELVLKNIEILEIEHILER